MSPSYQVLWEDNEHALIELGTPTEPATAAPGKRVQDSSVIVRCNVETGSCERASDPFSASEFGLAPLTVSNPLGTSHRTPDSQIQPTGNTQHPSSSSSPSATYPTQFAGLPAVGAPVSLPANGTLVLNISPGTGGDWHVYADGRIIWQRWSRDHAPLVIPKGADPLHTSYVQQRLTPLGVQLLTSRILAIGGAVGLFDHNVELGWQALEKGGYSDWYQVCNNGHLIYSQVLPPSFFNTEPRMITPAQKRALAQVDTLLADSTSLLPASAWADRTIRPYVPSHYQLSWDRADPDPSKLPSPAREALAKVLLGLNSQGTITTEQAQTLLAAFRQSRVKIDSQPRQRCRTGLQHPRQRRQLLHRARNQSSSPLLRSVGRQRMLRREAAQRHTAASRTLLNALTCRCPGSLFADERAGSVLPDYACPMISQTSTLTNVAGA